MYPPPITKMRSEVVKTTGTYRRYLVDPHSHEEFNLTLRHDHMDYLKSSGTLSSQDHPGWKASLGKRDDVGGPFFVEKQEMTTVPPQVDRTVRAANIGEYLQYYDLKGTLWPCAPSMMVFPPSPASDQYQMNMWGAEAVAKAAPGTSPMNLAVALGELKKDGIPSMIGSTFKRRAGVAKAAGDEYLNAQFGWAPLVKDVKSLAKTVTSADAILQQMERDAGKVVRRRVTLQDTSEVLSIEPIGTGTVTIGGTGSSLISELYPDGPLWRTTELNRKVWFSGAFTYYLPPDYYSRDAIRSAAVKTKLLYGLKLNPHTLWNLAPWSWAADWFSNADEVISNTTRFLTEGLVMHHGYLMEHSVLRYTYTTMGSGVPSFVLQTETKGRMKANPFGFGVDFNSLNGFQASILVALGISRRG